MTIRTAALVARHTLPDALATLTEAATWLDAHGCTPVVEAESATRAGIADRWRIVPRESLGLGADVVIAFGGDGTLLDAASAVAHSTADTPLLGVNLGRLGFLTEVGRSELLGALDALLSGRTEIETRLLLDGAVERAGKRLASRLALNDVVVTRGAFSRMIEIDVSVDGRPVCHVKADGLILATATGSTAYNLSAGGPIVHPAVDALVLTPIAPHTLTNRPLVLPATAHVTLQPLIEPQGDVILTFDGQFGIPLAAGDVATITRAARELRLLRTSSRTHFDMLREKLKWGNS
jgi:NAD+ kinase